MGVSFEIKLQLQKASGFNIAHRTSRLYCVLIRRLSSHLIHILNKLKQTDILGLWERPGHYIVIKKGVGRIEIGPPMQCQATYIGRAALPSMVDFEEKNKLKNITVCMILCQWMCEPIVQADPFFGRPGLRIWWTDWFGLLYLIVFMHVISI